jgi:hypothetical protein
LFADGRLGLELVAKATARCGAGGFVGVVAEERGGCCDAKTQSAGLFRDRE